MHEPSQTFAAYLLQPGSEADPSQGHIVLDPWRLQFQSPLVNLEIPLARLELEVQQDEGGRVILRDSAKPELEVCTYDAEILQHRMLLQQTHTRAQIQAIQSAGELKRRILITCGFLAACIVLAVGVSSLTGMLVRSLVAKVPVKWERDLGDSLLEDVGKHAQFSTDKKLVARLDRAVAPLLAGLPRSGLEFRFHIVEDPPPNAFALPGGHVLVTTGLLELMDQPEELAGVVAHEVAHVTEKHGFRKAISAAGPFLIFRVFLRQGDGLLGVLNNGSQLLVQQSFSQEYELEADSVGWRYLVASRIDPRGFIQALKKLRAEQTRLRAASDSMFSSHPPTEKRIRRLESLWKKLPNKSGFIEYRPTA